MYWIIFGIFAYITISFIFSMIIGRAIKSMNRDYGEDDE